MQTRRNRKFLKNLSSAIILAICFSLTAYSAENEEQKSPDSNSSATYQSNTGFMFTAKVGANLLSTISNIVGSDSITTFSGAIGADYFLTENVGVFLDLQYLKRGYGALTLSGSNSASYLDIPLGLGFNINGSWLKTARNHFKIGSYLALPLSDFTGPLTVSNSSLLTTKTYIGLYFAGETIFPITQHFALGFTGWGKLGLGAIASTTTADSKASEFGLGIVFAWY